MTPIPARTSLRSVRVLFSIALLSLFAGLPAVAHAAGISGRVVDPDGRPVTATVLIDGPLGTRAIQTDSDGRFTATLDDRATYRVLVQAPGFVADPAIVRGDDTTPLTIALRVAPVSDAVVVLASQVPRLLSEAPSTSTVIDRREIEARQLETVSDALRTLPGFTVARSGGRGALTSVFPRGGESDYTLVFVDGLQVNAFGGGLDFSLLPFGDVAQVETVSGPQSALFGSNAIGGIVQVTTRNGGPATASAAVEGGSDALFHARAGGAATRGAWSFGGGIERSSTDGYSGIAPASGETVSNDDWRHTNASGSLGWTHGDATTLRATARWIDADRGNPGPYGSNPIGAFPGVSRVARGGDSEKQAGVSGHLPWSESLKGRVQQAFDVTYADLDNTFRDTFGDSMFSTNRTTARTQTDAALSPSLGVSAGVEYLGERARSTYVVGELGQQVPVERHQLGAFGELRQDLGSRATITAGLRVDRIERQALEGSLDPFSPRPPFPADDVTSVNPRLAAMVAVWQDARGAVRTKLHASLGTGIRPPDAFEIAFTDNPSLKPERSRSLDVGVNQAVTDRLSVDATYFYNRYDDLIVATGSFADASHFQTDNISNARAQGLELAASWRGPRGFSARGTYTFLPTDVLAVDGTTSAPPPFAVGDPLIRRPRHQGSLSLLWAKGPATAFADARARGTELDVEPNLGTFGGLFRGAGYYVVDAGGSWRLRPWLEVYARGMNLFDRAYEEVYGYPALGRTATGGVRVAFRP